MTGHGPSRGRVGAGRGKKGPARATCRPPREPEGPPPGFHPVEATRTGCITLRDRSSPPGERAEPPLWAAGCWQAILILAGQNRVFGASGLCRPRLSLVCSGSTVDGDGVAIGIPEEKVRPNGSVERVDHNRYAVRLEVAMQRLDVTARRNTTHRRAC